MAYYIIFDNTRVFTADNEEALTALYPDYTPMPLPADYNSGPQTFLEGLEQSLQQRDPETC